MFCEYIDSISIQVPIQLLDYITINRMAVNWIAGNWMAICLRNHLAIRHVLTIQLPDLSGNCIIYSYSLKKRFKHVLFALFVTHLKNL